MSRGVYPSMQWARGCLHLGQDTLGRNPLGHTPPLGKHPWTHNLPGQTPPLPVEMTIEAGGTHPTGMHSCYYFNLHINAFNWLLFPNYFHQKLYENANIAIVVIFAHHGKTRISANNTLLKNKHDEIALQMNSALNCFRSETASLKISRIFNEDAHVETQLDLITLLCLVRFLGLCH